MDGAGELKVQRELSRGTGKKQETTEGRREGTTAWRSAESLKEAATNKAKSHSCLSHGAVCVISGNHLGPYNCLGLTYWQRPASQVCRG